MFASCNFSALFVDSKGFPDLFDRQRHVRIIIKVKMPLPSLQNVVGFFCHIQI